MNIISYDAICVISNIFGTYVLYKIMNIFYEYREYNKEIELLSFAAYCIITSCIQILFPGTIISHTAYLLLIPLLTLNYFHDKRLRINTLSIVLPIYLVIEAAAFFSNQLLNFENKDILILVFAKMAAFMAMVAMKKIIEKSRCKHIQFGLMLFMPVGTSYLFYLIILAKPDLNLFSIIGSLIIYMMNFCIFLLYKMIIDHNSGASFEKLYADEIQDNLRLKRIVYNYQEECNNIQTELKQKFYQVMRFLEDDENDEALQCLKEIGEIEPYFYDSAYSGNKEIDEILNSELSDAKELGIEIDLHAILPKDISKEVIDDLRIVLSNLIKNAIIESLKVLQPNRRIRIIMDYKENSIQMSIAYSYNGKEEEGVCFYDAKTSEIDRKKIYGLNEIIEIIKKYNTFLTVMDLGESKDAYLSIKIS